MQRRQNNLIAAMRLVRLFLTTNAAVLGTGITAGARAAFDAALDALENHRADQNEHGRGITSAVSAKGTGTAALVRKHMRPIAAIARLDLGTVPEFRALTTVPIRVSIGTLIGAGKGMAASAKLYEAHFIEAGLALDFIAQLTQAVNALEVAEDSKGMSRSLKVAATKGLGTSSQRARAAVNVINAVIIARLADGDPLLDQWNNVRRVVTAGITSATAPVTSLTPSSTPSTPSSAVATEAPAVRPAA